MNADIAVQDEDEVKYHPNLPKKAQGNPKVRGVTFFRTRSSDTRVSVSGAAACAWRRSS